MAKTTRKTQQIVKERLAKCEGADTSVRPAAVLMTQPVDMPMSAPCQVIDAYVHPTLWAEPASRLNLSIDQEASGLLYEC